LQPLFTLLGKQCAAPTAMSPRLQRAALLKLLAHAAYCGHAKTKKLGNFARALASLVKLQNALAHRNRYGSHEHTVLHIFPFVKLHYLWKRSKVGIPPVQNSAFYVFCFEGEHGLLDSVVTPQYSLIFKDYRRFKGKRVPRLLVAYPEPGTTIEAKVTELSELTNIDESQFTISQPTPIEKQLRSVMISEAELRKMSLKTPEIAWPSVRSDKTSGVLSIYVSIDNTGRVRETFPLNSDNAGLDDVARQQVQKWQFKPAVSDGAPVQVEGILTFAFNTEIENPVTILPDAEARKLATNTVEPIFQPGTANPGTSVTVRVSVDVDGKLLGVENPNNASDALFFAAYAALKQWRFQPYLKDGKPDFYKADITFRVPLR